MGKEECANQQPTQNLRGRGRRDVDHTAHTMGTTSLGSGHPPSLRPHEHTAQAEVWDPN